MWPWSGCDHERQVIRADSGLVNRWYFGFFFLSVSVSERFTQWGVCQHTR